MAQNTYDIARQVDAFRREWLSDVPAITLRTSGSTGRPKEILAGKRQMRSSARRTCRALGIEPGSTTLLCMPMDYIAGRMVCVRAWECGLRLIAVPPSLHPLSTLHKAPHFAAMTPAQVYESLSVPDEAALLRQIRVLLVGGGSVGDETARSLHSMAGAWATYGMTETLSHIALRPFAGEDDAYTPFPDVSLSTDGRGCLVVSDSATGVEGLATNDLAELLPDGRFRILGRVDNVICSGSLKWQAEDLEARLAPLPVPFRIGSVPDERLGQAIALLYEAPPGSGVTEELLRNLCRRLLPRHAVPRLFVRVPALPQTPTGKPDRARAAALLLSGYGAKPPV